MRKNKKLPQDMPIGAQTRPKPKKGTVGRIIKLLFKFYPRLIPLTAICIIFSAIVSSVPALFLQRVTAIVERYVKSGNWASAKEEIIPQVLLLILLYVS